MIAFLIELENKAGSAAEVAEAIAERGIQVIGGAGVALGSSGVLAIATNDEPGTRRILLGRGWRFREAEIVPLNVAGDPDKLARACRALGEAGINVDSFFPMFTTPEGAVLAFATDDTAQARSILASPSLARSR